MIVCICLSAFAFIVGYLQGEAKEQKKSIDMLVSYRNELLEIRSRHEDGKCGE